MSIELSFHGGVDTVTGSCHLLRTDDLTLLVDCGMFQGDPSWEDRNFENFPFDPRSVDYLLLTHGHLDHCGRIPLLVKAGFNGKIICTSATYDIAKIILMDSAQINEEDYAKWKKIWKRRGEKPRNPLYTMLDVMDSLRLFGEFAEYMKPVQLGGGVTVAFRDAGHILGSSFLEIDVKGEKRIVFSGDLGNRNKPIIRNPSFPNDADIIIVESTYARRDHKDFDESKKELAQVIRETCRRGGNTLIPAFAIERAQELLYVLRQFSEDAEMPRCSVFLDSPMAINVTGVMKRHPESFDAETLHLFNNDRSPFLFPGLEFTKTPEDSRKINSIESNAVIIAGSGMCTGGRIKHHLKHNIWRQECSIVFVGFQAKGTLGREIVDGEKRVKIFGDTYRVNAQVHTIGGFSSHADRDILLDWLGHSKGTGHIFVVHGEQEERESFRDELARRNLAKEIHAPHFGASFSF